MLEHNLIIYFIFILLLCTINFEQNKIHLKVIYYLIYIFSQTILLKLYFYDTL